MVFSHFAGPIHGRVHFARLMSSQRITFSLVRRWRRREFGSFSGLVVGQGAMCRWMHRVGLELVFLLQ